MPLNIEHPEADRPARALAQTTGETITEAVLNALKERLQRETGRRESASLRDDLRRIQRHFVRSRNDRSGAVTDWKTCKGDYCTARTLCHYSCLGECLEAADTVIDFDGFGAWGGRASPNGKSPRGGGRAGFFRRETPDRTSSPGRRRDGTAEKVSVPGQG